MYVSLIKKNNKVERESKKIIKTDRKPSVARANEANESQQPKALAYTCALEIPRVFTFWWVFDLGRKHFRKLRDNRDMILHLFPID